MKIIKLIFLLTVLTIYCGASPIYSQSLKVKEVLKDSELKEVEQAVNLYWKWDRIEESIEAVNLLEKISQNDSNNWVAPYWATYISTQLINSDKKYEKTCLEKANVFMDRANKAHARKSDKNAKPYFHALQSLIYRFESFKYATLKDKKNYDIFQEKSKQELNDGAA